MSLENNSSLTKTDGTLDAYLDTFHGEPSQGFPETTPFFSTSHEKPWIKITENHLTNGIFNLYTEKLEDKQRRNFEMILSSMDRLSPENLEKEMPGFDFSKDGAFYKFLSEAERTRFAVKSKPIADEKKWKFTTDKQTNSFN